MAKLPIDVQQAIKRQAPRLLKKDFKRITEKRFKKIKQRMIAEFLENPITMEIMGGPNSPNLSGSLDGVINLFAFIGFDQGDDPIAPILARLEETHIQFSKFLAPSSSKVGMEFDIALPTPEEVFAITPLPWASGRSWAQGIERGLSGLGYLLRKNEGRSGAAIQSRVKVRGGAFKNRPYISAFLRKYKMKFEDLK
jgi:hypothetical protein